MCVAENEIIDLTVDEEAMIRETALKLEVIQKAPTNTRPIIFRY